jgi:hypothetical protein
VPCHPAQVTASTATNDTLRYARNTSIKNDYTLRPRKQYPCTDATRCCTARSTQYNQPIRHWTDRMWPSGRADARAGGEGGGTCTVCHPHAAAGGGHHAPHAAHLGLALHLQQQAQRCRLVPSDQATCYLEFKGVGRCLNTPSCSACLISAHSSICRVVPRHVQGSAAHHKRWPRAAAPCTALCWTASCRST